MLDKTLKTDWPILSFFLSFHLLAIYGLTMPTTGGMIAFGIMYAATVLGITIGFHRLFTHHGFKCKKWLRRLLAVMGTLALQGNIREWVAHHRLHHNASDTIKDPHNAARGFWYSHCLWMLKVSPVFDDIKRQNRLTKDVLSDPFCRFLCKPVVFVGMQVLLGIFFWISFGFEAMLWGIFVRLVAVYHVTWFVNSACHKWGYKNYQVNDLATNCWWVAILSFGEGWHNNHHAHDQLARHGHRWWEFDLSWQVIKLLRLLGLVWDVKEPDPQLNATTKHAKVAVAH